VLSSMVKSAGELPARVPFFEKWAQARFFCDLRKE
jgi:hypothetical protein